VCTFLELCVKGEISPDRIDDYVDTWHKTDSKKSLSDYLGMTRKEYLDWVIDPSRIIGIVSARRKS
jgi:hypothetical protein